MTGTAGCGAMAAMVYSVWLLFVSDVPAVGTQFAYAVMLIICIPAVIFFAGFGTYNLWLFVNGTSTKAHIKGTTHRSTDGREEEAKKYPMTYRLRRLSELLQWGPSGRWAAFRAPVSRARMAEELQRRAALKPHPMEVPPEVLEMWG